MVNQYDQPISTAKPLDERTTNLCRNSYSRIIPDAQAAHHA